MGPHHPGVEDTPCDDTDTSNAGRIQTAHAPARDSHPVVAREAGEPAYPSFAGRWRRMSFHRHRDCLSPTGMEPEPQIDLKTSADSRPAGSRGYAPCARSRWVAWLHSIDIPTAAGGQRWPRWSAPHMVITRLRLVYRR